MDEYYYRKPPPPLPPLWEGVYSFPGRPANIAPWLILTAYLGIIACCLSWMYLLLGQMFGFGPETVLFGAGPVIVEGSFYVFKGLFILPIFFSVHVSIFFMQVLEETAAGNDEVRWSKDPWLDMIGKWISFLWLTLCSLVLAFVVDLGLVFLFPVPRLTWWCLLLVFTWLFFPIPLYSTMSAGKPWMIIEPQILLRLVQKPLVLVYLYLNVVVIFLVCAGLAYPFLVNFWSFWVLLPIISVTWSTAVLIYGRVLGRVAYALTQEDKPRGKKRRKRRKAAESERD
jgi:hypothetical protein